MTDVVDEQLERLIRARASTDHGTPADEREELWKASVRAHHKAIRRRNRAAWFSYFCGQARAHAALAADYERRAEELCQEGAA